MIVAALRETLPGERRVALIPAVVPALVRAGADVVVESGSGEAAGFLDSEYEQKGARVVASREQALGADVILCVWALTADNRADLERLSAKQTLIAMCDPLGTPHNCRDLASRGTTVFALELIPRITRAQSMDVLSSMATVAGYRAVLLAALHLPKMFPMMMTAAGTLTAAKVFVVGAGVAGLQAIASSRRLGAVVQAYDVRPAVKEQVESLGAKFVEMELGTSSAEGAGGYARSMDEAFYARQRELMTRVVSESDVCITTALIPGQPAPRLITAEAARQMRPGSVIVDLAAERGGNCELTRRDQTVCEGGVTILGPTNLPSDVPHHASQMYAKNITTFLLNMLKQGRLELNLDDEIVRETLVARGGQVVHPRVRSLLGLPEAMAHAAAGAVGGTAAGGSPAPRSPSGPATDDADESIPLDDDIPLDKG
jgi:NAD(P) transhydrogenase subunit alpha